MDLFDPPLGHVPRRISFHGARRRGPWTVKLYGIAGRGEDVAPPLLDASLEIASRVLPLPAVTAGRYGVGFVIVHEAPAFNTIVVDWWEQVNELRHRVFRARPAEPDRFDDITGSGESVCVWELKVQAYERELWIAEVLGGDAGKGLVAYAHAGLDGAF